MLFVAKLSCIMGGGGCCQSSSRQPLSGLPVDPFLLQCRPISHSVTWQGTSHPKAVLAAAVVRRPHGVAALLHCATIVICPDRPKVGATTCNATVQWVHSSISNA